MARIAMLLDVEEGHFLSTFKLAKDLRARGHSVHYLGLSTAAPLVHQQGFDFIPVLSEILAGQRAAAVASTTSFDLEQALVDGALDGAIERLRPDGLILLSMYYLEALLVECRYHLPVVLLTPQYRHETRARAMEKAIADRFFQMRSEVAQKVLALVGARDRRLRSFGDLAQILTAIPELVLLPRAFDLPELAGDPDVTYVGAGVDLERAEEPFDWEALDPRLPLVYCSLGSQADISPDLARRFFRCVGEAAAARPDLQFLLSVGRGFSLAEIAVRPPNLEVSNWVPQMAVLERAHVMVNHAGSGTVKECILRGVPMVVMPLMRDQFDCARRVVHHGLGLKGEVKGLTAAGLLELIDGVARDPGFRRRVAAMRDWFLADNDAGLGAILVEAAVARGCERQAVGIPRGAAAFP
jgi:zeaxanthin glucosyltransferase